MSQIFQKFYHQIGQVTVDFLLGRGFEEIAVSSERRPLYHPSNSVCSTRMTSNADRIFRKGHLTITIPQARAPADKPIHARYICIQCRREERRCAILELSRRRRDYWGILQAVLDGWWYHQRGDVWDRRESCPNGPSEKEEWTDIVGRTLKDKSRERTQQEIEAIL